jgi:CheY-like chemotaxis protein
MQQSRKNILMIDDSAELVEVVRALFDPKEYLFVSATNGVEGLFKAKNQNFDVIICDIRMPRMDGLKFIKEFRSGVKGLVPILIYSGHMEVTPPDIEELKAIYRLNKPSQAYELKEKVRSIIDSAEAAKSIVSKSASSKLTGFYGLKGTEKKFAADSFVFNEGDRGADGFFIVEGEIEILKEASNAAPVLLDILGPGDFLGALVPDDGHYYTYTARTKTAVKLQCYSQVEIQAEIEKLPPWARSMVQTIGKRLVKVQQRLKPSAKAS